MRRLDLPQLWFAGFLVLGWLGRGAWGGMPVLGGALALIGLGLIAWASLTIRRARTTINPYGTPSALVQHGPFARSRNPIYLANAVMLVAAAIWWGSALALICALIWGPMISRRFIAREELALLARFGRDAQGYFDRVRRWI